MSCTLYLCMLHEDTQARAALLPLYCRFTCCFTVAWIVLQAFCACSVHVPVRQNMLFDIVSMLYLGMLHEDMQAPHVQFACTFATEHVLQHAEDTDVLYIYCIWTCYMRRWRHVTSSLHTPFRQNMFSNTQRVPKVLISV
jgi:hypothetical protein